MASKIPAGASQESTDLSDDYFNHLKIVRLVCNVGSTVLLELLYSKVQSRSTTDILMHLKGTIPGVPYKGYQKRKLMSIIKGSVLNLRELDVSLLAFILKNTLPLAAQEENNIDVIINNRNMLSHSRDPKIDTIEFQKKWQELSHALVDIADSIHIKEFVEQTDKDIKVILSEQAAVQQYKEMWSRVNDNENEIAQLVEDLDATNEGISITY